MIDVHIRIGEIDRERSIVVLYNRTQQQGSLALKTQFVPRQITSVVEVETLRAFADNPDVAVIIEDREGVTVLEAAQGTLNEGPLDLDIMPGQLYRSVWVVLDTANGLNDGAADCRSP